VYWNGGERNGFKEADCERNYEKGIFMVEPASHALA